ncbi:DUF5011 domain-containing protein [Hyalangium versicolor]|uniref:DUF5011 domain-containing protein n=1 Tax=Hyalangium versicolor TaxID=2861190 RepID=UPI001CCB7EDC|nr:DUF5011 domain-containing protein [Hyalangium versicolor]
MTLIACGQENAPPIQQESTVGSRQDALAQNKALILGRTVTGGEDSVEAAAVREYGMAVTVATDAQWAAMTPADFASYRVIILGDASCANLDVVSAAVANRHIWGPTITGNIFIAGTAPVDNGATEVTQKAIRFASSLSGMTGLYASLSCYYKNAAPNTHVELLEPFGYFAVQSGGCHDTAHIVSDDPALSTLTDAAMSNWPCSVGTQFDSFPQGDFAPWSIAAYEPGTSPSSQNVQEFGDGTMGAPYILARGTVMQGCGNYDQDMNEECDWGNESNGLPGMQCSSTCRFHWCGDGVVDADLGETCDQGANNGSAPGACPRSCRVLPPPPPSHRPPLAICKHMTVSAGPTCGGVSASIDNGSSDPDGDMVGCVQSVTSFEQGLTTVSLTCTDAQGLTGSCTGSVRVVDDMAPSITCPAASSFECGVGSAELTPARAEDNCTTPKLSYSMESEGFSVGSERHVTWYAHDGENSASCTTSVKMVDTLAPSLSLKGETSQLLECGASAYSEAGALASDKCAGDLTSRVAISGAVNVGAVGLYPVSYSVADGAGNVASATRTVRVADTLAPALALKGEGALAVECGVGQYTEAGATASDVCAGDLSSRVAISGAVNAAAPGAYALTYSVADGAGHSVSATRTVSVNDTLAPSLSLVGEATMNLECGVGGFANPGATASDACAGDLTSAIATSGTVNAAARGAYALTYSVADGAGHSVSATRTVNVNDTKAPTLSLVGAASVKLECGVDSFTNAGATASDLCAGDLTSAIATSGTVNTAAVGSYPVSYSVADPAGNAASATRTVQVADTKAPSIALNGASTVAVECGVGQYTESGATAADACTGNLSSKVAISGTVNAAVRGSYTKSYSVTDASGNTASTVRTVNVNDTLAPSLALLGTATMKLECGVDTFVNPGATAVDACAGTLTAAIATSGTVNTAAVGSYPVTYRVADAVGNAATATRTVQVADTKAPSLVLKGTTSMTLECGVGTYTESGATATDVCTGDLSSKVAISGTVNAAVRGSYTKSYSVADASGNTATATRTVSVTDTKAPTLSLVGAATMTVNRGSTFTDPGATATDSCSGTLTSAIVKTGSVNTSVVGTYTLRYTVADGAGLSASVTRSVTVQDSCNTVVTVKPVQKIWPPNHNYQSFTLSDCAAVTTNCGTGGGCHGDDGDIDDMGKILSIYSDEVEDSNGNGDGNTDDDIVITGPSSFKLRAEREGKGNGRVYGIRFKVIDSSGAAQTATCKFAVPHDQGDTNVVDNGAAAGYTVNAPNW